MTPEIPCHGMMPKEKDFMDMWKKIQHILIAFILIGIAIILIGDAVYKGLTKDYYICEECDKKHYPKLEGKGVQIKDIWLDNRCYSMLNLEAGRELGMGNLEDGDMYEQMDRGRRRWVYEEAKKK